MKVIVGLAVISILATAPAYARGGGGHGSSRSSSGIHFTRTYVTKSGTLVQGHWSTNPNATRNDNWSTRGNVNPVTGEEGTKPRDEDPKN